MGKSYSSLLVKEQHRWSNHTLEFNANKRDRSLELLKKTFLEGAEVSLFVSPPNYNNLINCEIRTCILLTTSHALVIQGREGPFADRALYDAGSCAQIVSLRELLGMETPWQSSTPAELQLYNPIVALMRQYFPRAPASATSNTDTTTVNSELRQRIADVLGMSNFSVCLRNSEHVMNYCLSDRWFSKAMAIDGELFARIRKHMPDSARCFVNSFPSSFVASELAHSSNEPLYSFLTPVYQFHHFSYFLDQEYASAYSVLVVGPSGAGKSHLINTFFNRQLVRSAPSFRSVTRDVGFLHGIGSIYNAERGCYHPRQIVVVDTIGLCDSSLEENHVENLIEQRVSCNVRKVDAVLVVLSAGRLQAAAVDSIRRLLGWLNYEERSQSFQFVITHAEYLTSSEKQQMASLIGLTFRIPEATQPASDDYSPIAFIGLPSEEYLTDQSRPSTERDWRHLHRLLTTPSPSGRLRFGRNDENSPTAAGFGAAGTGPSFWAHLGRYTECTIL